MTEARPTIYPTLVIGLGGSGTETVRYVKRRFLRTWRGNAPGNLEDLPAVLQVLAVDTEPLVNPPDEEPLYSHEFAFLGKFDATRLIQNRRNHTPYLDWWRWGTEDIPLGYIHNGARQLRPIGRLAFFRNYVTFKSLMVDKLRALRQLSAIQEAEERGFPVASDHRLIYIITSICGGTGAGMFLDVAHRVRHEVGSNADIIGIFLMPSTFENEIRSDLQRRRIRANAYAALKELNYFHETQTFSALYPSEQGLIPSTHYRAFSRIFLVERTNSAGLTLSSKRQAEQMTAHLIHLMSLSHLNQRILGLDVNVTEERSTDGANDQQTYLSYSSFSTSALVMPQDALWRYFVSIITYWATDMLLTGEDESWEEAQIWPDYLALRDNLKAAFRRYQFTEEELAALKEDVAHGDGRWLGFAEIVFNAFHSALAAYGLQGAKYIIHRLTLDEDSSELVRDDLSHSRQCPFEVVPEIHRPGLIKRIFTSARELAEIEEAHEKWQMHERRRESWKTVLQGLQTLARDWERQIDRVMTEVAEAQDACGRDVATAADRVNPLRRQGDNDTSTYYDLETGAINRELLDAYAEMTSTLLDEPVSGDDGAPSRWSVLLEALQDYLLDNMPPDGDNTPAELSASGLRAVVETQFSTNANLITVRQEVAKAFDLRNVVQAQQSGSYRPANYRVYQLFQRMAPHLSVDGDTYPYTEANEEHVRLVTTPSAMEEEENTAFRQAMRSYDNFEWVPTGDPNRIDACHIVHGLPLIQLSSMPELYEQYASGEFDRRTLHVQADWVDFPEVYAPAINGADPAKAAQAQTARENSLPGRRQNDR